jgi:hypothetical protein
MGAGSKVLLKGEPRRVGIDLFQLEVEKPAVGELVTHRPGRVEQRNRSNIRLICRSAR